MDITNVTARHASCTVGLIRTTLDTVGTNTVQESQESTVTPTAMCGLQETLGASDAPMLRSDPNFLMFYVDVVQWSEIRIVKPETPKLQHSSVTGL